jgi:hypothetical protein
LRENFFEDLDLNSTPSSDCSLTRVLPLPAQRTSAQPRSGPGYRSRPSSTACTNLKHYLVAKRKSNVRCVGIPTGSEAKKQPTRMAGLGRMRGRRTYRPDSCMGFSVGRAHDVFVQCDNWNRSSRPTEPADHISTHLLYCGS